MADGASVVLVTVGNDDTLYFIAALNEIREIRDDVIDPQHIIFREHQPGIDHQDLAFVFIHHHVGADFPQSTQRDDL